MSDTDRVLPAVRLESDETVALVGRVAGRLVLQYGQSCGRLVNLTVEHVLVHPDEPVVLGLRLGRDPLWLRHRLSALLRSLVDQRQPLAYDTRARPSCFRGCGPAGR